MEYYQTVQNRALQTAAVVTAHLPTLKVGTAGAAQLVSMSTNLGTLALTRDQRIGDSDMAVNAEYAGYRLLQKLDLTLAASAAAELDESLTVEEALEELLQPVFGIAPDTTEHALERAQKLQAALESINLFLGAQIPVRGPITSGGRGLAQLTAAIAAQPPLEADVETKAAAVTKSRSALRLAARELDRLNKRFYGKLKAEARDNAALAEALGQIVTDDANLPATLGIRRILQGGVGGLQLLVSFDNASFDPALENTVEYFITGVEADWMHKVPADPSGNALGPFTIGQTIQLRTRTRNANGTTTSSIRTLTLGAPVL